MTKTKFLGLKKPAGKDYFNVEDFNENAEIIDEAFEDGSAKIGDIKITIRKINDEKWLLCNSQIITEENYPELYAYLGVEYNIFNNAWKEQAMVNGGAAPVYAADGYVYFIPNRGTSAYRCKPDFSEYESYTLLKTAAKYIYYDGLWFCADSTGLHYSNDGFKENISSNTSFTLPDSDYSFYSISYGEGYWYVGRTYYNGRSSSDYYGQTFRTNSLTENFTEFLRSNLNSRPNDEYSGYNPESKIPIVIYETSGAAHLFVQYNIYYPQFPYYNMVHYYYPDGLSGSFVKGECVAKVKPSFVLEYIKETGHVYASGCLLIGEKMYSPSEISLNKPRYFKGNYYTVSSDGTIYRFNAYDTLFSNIESTEYYKGALTSIGIGASDTHLYVLKDTDTVLYIDDFEERVLPAIEIPSPYKTYIKAK